MSDLLLLDDAAHLDQVVARRPGLLEKTRPVTADLVVASRLEELGVAFHDLWALLDGDDLARNRVRTHEINARWWGSDDAAVPYRGRTLPEVAIRELHEPVETCLNARTAFERLFDLAGPTTVHGFFLRPVIIRRCGPAPLNRASLSLAHTVVRWLARRRGIAVDALAQPPALSDEQRGGPPTGVVPPIRAPDVARAWLSPEVPGHVAWDGLRPDFARLRTTGRLALLLENVQNPRELHELETTFGQRPDWAIVRLIASVEGPCRSWPRHLRPLLASVKQARARFAAWRRSYDGDVPEVFANPGLRRQFDSIWADLLMGVGLGESFAHALELLRPDVAVFAFASFVLERILVRVARQQSVPAVGLLHGGLNPYTDANVLAGDESDLLVWGEADVRWNTPGPPGRALHVVGSPRYCRAYQAWGSGAPPRDARQRSAARASLGLPPQQPLVLLVTSALNSGFCMVNGDAARHRASWRELLALATRRPDLTFVLKPHPTYDFFAFYRYLAAKAPPNLHLCWDELLSTLLPVADVGVLVNCCTTGALEAILADLPVVFLRAATYTSSLHKDSLREHGAINVSTVAELETTIDALMHDSQLRARARATAAPLLREVLDDPSRLATDRIVDKLEEIAASGPTQPSQPPAETRLARQYAEVVALLAPGRASAAFEGWGNFVAALRLAAAPIEMVRAYLFRLGVDIGRSIANVEEMLALVRRCRRAATGLGLTAADGRGMLVNAALASLRWYSHAPDSPPGARLLALVRRLEPRAVWRAPQGAELLRRLDAGCPDSTLSLREKELGDRVQHLEQEVAALRHSWTWKLGRLLTGPLAHARRLLRLHR